MAFRRAVALTVAGVTTLAVLGGCAGSGRSTSTQAGQVAVVGPAAGTAWSDVLSQIRPDGTVPLAAALEAFTLTVGPLPGVTPPPGPTGTIADATIAVRSVIGHWDALTPAQQAAVRGDLVAADQQAQPAAPRPTASGRPDPAGPPSARSAAPVELVAYRPAAPAVLLSVPSAGPYLAVAAHARSLIAAAMGRDTPQTISVVINATQQGDPSWGAYTDSYDSGWGYSGQAAHCVIHINPLLYHFSDPNIVTASAVLTGSIAHEVFHCFQADDYPSPAASGRAPAWLIEGQAEWVGETIAPETAESPYSWNPYLTKIDTALFARAYDAMGFYAHLAESGVDPWGHFDNMLKAPDNAAAYASAVNDTFRHDWASSLARQPAFGEGWDTTGPAIPSTAYQPTVSELSNTTVLHATVAPYTNGIAEFNATADIVSIDVTNLYGRLHASTDYNGADLTSAQFCIKQCAACPNLASLPRLAEGPMWLAVTGDAGGASYTITGAAATCAPAPCMVGDWVSTIMTVTYSGGQQSGGAGHQLHISADGSLTAVYTGMRPIGSLQPTGTATGKVALPTDPTADTGRWVVTGVNSAGVSESVNTPNGSRVVPGAHFVADTSSGTWTCKGDTMTVAVQPLTITLARKTP